VLHVRMSALFCAWVYSPCQVPAILMIPSLEAMLDWPLQGQDCEVPGGSTLGTGWAEFWLATGRKALERALILGFPAGQGRQWCVLAQGGGSRGHRQGPASYDLMRVVSEGLHFSPMPTPSEKRPVLPSFQLPLSL
jgi:hypothetical protein